MKTIGFALVVIALALAVSPRAISDPVRGSNSAAAHVVIGFNSSSIGSTNRGLVRLPDSENASLRNSGQVTRSGYSDSGVMEVSEVVGEPAPTDAIPIRPEIAKPTVSDLSTITGSGLMKSAPKPAIRAISGSANGSRQSLDRDSSSAAPEPSSLVLLGTGLLGLAFVVFRKAKSSAVVMQE